MPCIDGTNFIGVNPVHSLSHSREATQADDERAPLRDSQRRTGYARSSDVDPLPARMKRLTP